MNFEDFNNQKTMTAEAIAHALKVTDLSCYEEYFSKQALGKWAWEELKKLELVCENVRKCRIHEYNLLKEIAIACLGKKEIIKRLSTIKEVIE